MGWIYVKYSWLFGWFVSICWCWWLFNVVIFRIWKLLSSLLKKCKWKIVCVIWYVWLWLIFVLLMKCCGIVGSKVCCVSFILLLKSSYDVECKICWICVNGFVIINFRYWYYCVWIILMKRCCIKFGYVVVLIILFVIV